MNRFVVLFYGGMPKEEDRETHMAEWGKWIENLTAKGVYEGGDPWGMEQIFVDANGTKDQAVSTSDPAGHMILKSESIQQVTELVGNAPHLKNGGHMLIRSIVDMGPKHN